MIMEGCQGKPQMQVLEKTCPQCGHEIEIFSIDTDAVCEHCGFKIYNDALNCARWCASARECLGEAAYRNATDVKKGRDHPSVPDKEASI